MGGLEKTAAPRKKKLDKSLLFLSMASFSFDFMKSVMFQPIKEPDFCVTGKISEREVEGKRKNGDYLKANYAFYFKARLKIS